MSVTVMVGTEELTATSTPTTWSVNVPPNAAYITGASVTVTVSATKTGFTAATEVTRKLTVDLAAPSASYTPPDTLQVGVALTAMTPSTTATDIASYAATGLPSGLVIDAGTGVISGTPDTANPTTATATVTVTDTAGNPADVSITFPMVAKGDQKLTDFSYRPATVTFGDAAPTVTAPTRAQTTVSYTATPADVCTVNATSGALTLVGMGDCVVTATAEATDNYNDATLDFTVTVQAVGTLALNLDAIATDDTVNIAEHEAGFTITGDTGTERDVAVTVTVGGAELTATSSNATPATWSVTVPPNAAYITGTSVTVTVSATKTGFTSPTDVTRKLAVDLAAPSATYTPPATLQVDVAISAMTPSTSATDIASYGATGLPSGLSINSTTGIITGTPDTANPSTATATVTVTDNAGNPADVPIAFPMVAKGDQKLTDFSYSPATVMFGDTAPTLTTPTGAVTTVSYAATPAEVCTVNATSGALTLAGMGDCVVTATAEATDNYNLAAVDFTVTVQAAGTLALNLDPIAGDDTVNIAEHEAGFAISGDTGSEGGVSVTVMVGTEELTATSTPTTWSVNVPPNAAYITGTSVTVTVSATKTGFTAANEVARKLAVDLAAPSATYTAPGTLQVGAVIAAMMPSTTASDIASYAATGLPSGLVIDAGTGVISGTPDTANPTTATATVTVTDTAGNPADVSITFPMVAKGDQKLTDFSYRPATVTFGDAAPTVTAPTRAQTTVSYTATPADVCTVNATSGALTLVGMGDCVVTATAEATANYNQATLEFTVTVQAAGTLALNLDPIAGDDTVNIAEHEAGFAISGDTGSEADVTVTVTVGPTELTATSNASGTWSVSVPPTAAYITGTSVTVTVSATKTGFTSPTEVTRKLAVDLAAPSATYTAPGTLQVGAVIADMMPSTTATDIASYGATGLPSGLVIDAGTGVISGTPDTADLSPATATVTVTDTAGNPTTVSITFPMVAKGDQKLTDFSYRPASMTFGEPAPTVTPPTGVQTTLLYSATPADVCTVNATSGALTLVGMGDCVVTATAAGTDNYNQATADFTVTVQPAGTLALNLDTIAGDDTVNLAEHADGFEISGDTGSEGGVSVTVTVGGTELTVTSTATAWSVTVPANATYITGTSVTVTVSATKTGFTSPSDVTRKLAVDLAAPSASYTPPATLQVGVAISAMTPIATATDIASYGATGLPSGLSIDAGTGDISGTPDTANPTTATATVTVTDNAGNPATVSITFPMVAKGDQKLTDFSYRPASMTFGEPAPTVTPPTGVQTTLLYSATPADVCTVNATSGALTLVGMGDCVVTATAAGTDNYNQATADFTVTVQPAGTLALNLDTIAGDDTVNLAEHADGFEISGDTGSEGGVSVTVTVGGTELTVTSTATAWSVTVPANATYITGTSVTVTVSATKTGFTSPTGVTRKLAVDLTAPTASYTAPGTLQVGAVIADMEPSTTATDIASYGATGLPSGLSIDSGSGVISGTPDTADPTTTTATVTVTDTAGNPAIVSITFPVVAKGDQTLTGFGYRPAAVMFGDPAPTVTPPTGVRTTVSYAATPPEVCTVNATSGVLTLVGMGDCVVTATAEATANYNEAEAEFTVTVAKGDQKLAGFSYRPASVTFGEPAPTVTPPTGVQTTLLYSATPADVCTVNATSGALTLVGMGDCVVTATAAGTDNYNQATADFTVTVQPAGTLALNLDTIAGDDTVNIAEHADGFEISGDTGSEGGVSVTVTVGGTELTVTSTATAWSVTVPANATYITGTSVTVTVSATKTGFTSPTGVARKLAVDLTAPTASYTAPGTLQVGAVIADMEPSTTASDIASYGATGLPSGLSIDSGSGVISGTPDTADPTTTTATVTVTDTAGNPAPVSILFPAVAKGDQTLTGFSYRPATVIFGDPVPTVTAPTGERTTLSYLAASSDVCMVNAATGALTLLDAGTCVVTATAEGTADYNQATTDFTVTVQPAGTLALNLDAIATDNTVNIAEHEAGFTISGNTGSEADVSVTVTVGTTDLTVTSTATAWSVTVPANATYITGTSVTVTVSATKTGFTSPTGVARLLAVDLTAPTASYTAPGTLQVGAVIADMEPSTTATDIASYGATGLPSGLSIDSGSGVISGTPDTADPTTTTTTATVTVTDTAGNPADVPILFPAVAKGDQKLTGFGYSSAAVMFGDPAPTVMPPTGVRTTLSYSATSSDVCTVNAATGALTLLDAGTCVVTATAEGTADYNQATTDFTVTVQPAGTLALNLDAIATDDTANIAEKAAGFTISGNTDSEADVSVTVMVSTTELTATSAANGAWSVSVPENATYITESSVTVTVSVTKAGFTSPSDVTRLLAVDLTAPTASYSAPATLQVGVAIGAMTPSTTATDITSYGATGLPSGLSINRTTGVISGTPDTARDSTSSATVTVTDEAGNPAAASITFPEVTKGDQTLTGFSYRPATVTFGDPAPTVIAPTGERTTLSYSATPATVCTVAAATGALTLLDAGTCEITATAEGTANYNQATATFTVTVQPVGTLVLNVDAIAGDSTVNIAEQAAGFTIGGNTGSEAGVSVRVTIGSQSPLAATSDAGGAWSVNVPANAAYITESSVTVTVSASKTGFTPPSDVTRLLAVDLMAPTASYSAPDALQVGVAIPDMEPSTSATDIDGYTATGLPSGLNIDAGTGIISGTPDTADASTQQATVTVTDSAGNPADASITFPAVAKGDQTLTGLSYRPATVTFGDPAPTVTAPTGERTTLSYSATPATVCTVAAATGALMLEDAGACVVTATAARTANYNEATATFTVTVQPVGTLALNLDTIATDDTVNIVEHEAGFTISGDTGSEGGVSVRVTIGTQSPLTATSATSTPTTWSVDVPADAAYITESGVTVTVSASKTGFTSPSPVTRKLAVDLTAPSVSYTAPDALQVGVAITDMEPSTTATDIASYEATGLPSGLSINRTTGVISGTPDTARDSTSSATVTVTDSAGNPAAVSILFPAVAKGDQTLTGFSYRPATVTFGDPAPTVMPPTGVRTTLSYSATSSDVCMVAAATGALTLLDAGTCEITATAKGTADYKEATATFTVIVQAAGTLALNLDTIATDDTVNIVEHEAGFTISGDTGSEGGVSVRVTIGTQSPLITTSAANGTWSVPVPANADYITGTSVTVTVSASKTGFISPNDVARKLAVDLTAPSVSYTAPGTLQVGVAIRAMTPSTSATDIASFRAPGLPSGLSINRTTGVISGTPDTAAGTSSATVTVTDSAGNPADASITFPEVAKGDQTLTGFAYGASSVMFGDPAPTVTAPTGVRTTLSYSATPATVCTVAAATGALTLLEAGTCVITATAASTDDYNEATADFTVTVRPAGTLALNLDAIAGDNTVNLAEKADGFTISGNSGLEADVSVGVTIGSQSPLTATSDAGGAWSVSVPANAAYITGTSVTVTVNATKDGFLPPSAVTRTLTVDLKAPTADYTAPADLKVGVAITDVTASTTATDIASYRATGLPSGLSINGRTGVIRGTPGTANANPASATVTVTDMAGNPADVTITFPVVAKGDQTLTGFAYRPATVTFGSAAPTVTAPTGVRTSLSYSATPSNVCTADSSTGALTLLAVGDCKVTATAAGTASYNEAIAPFTVTVLTSAPGAAVAVSLLLEPYSIYENGAVSTVTATLSGTSTATTTITVLAAAVMPATNADFTLSANRTLTIVPGATTSTGTVTITAVDNGVDAPDKTVTVSGTVMNRFGIVPPEAQPLTITDDDEPSATVTLAVSPSTVAEDATGDRTVTVTAMLDAGARTDDVQVTISVADGTAVAGTDFEAVSQFTVTIAARKTSGTGTFTLTPVDDDVAEDAETVMVDGTAPGLTVTGTTLTLTDDDDDERGVAKAWLARSGRTIAQHVLDGLQERLRAPREAGFEGALAGRVLDTSGAGWRAGRLPPRAGAREDGWRDAQREPVRSDGRTLTLRDLVTGSAFRVGAGSEETGFGAVWGRGTYSFVGGTEADLRLDGEVTTGMVGADYQRGRLTGGAALSHSEAEADYRSDAEEGRVGVSLTGVYPYAGYAVTDRVSVWGAGGYGEGELQVKPDEGERAKTDTRLTMVAAGLRGTLAERPDGLEAAVKADVLFLRMSSAETAELEAAEGRVGRVRLGLEGARPFALDNGASVAPELEVGVRHDGGDAETGFGLDLGAGLKWSAPGGRLTGNVDVHGLVVHEDEDFEEWTVSGAVRHAPATRSGRGLSYSLSQSWGAPGSGGGADRLWARETLSGMGAGGGGGSRGRLDVRAGYGFPMFGGRFTGTPHAGLGVSESVRDYRFGYRLDLVGGKKTQLGLGIEARVPDAVGHGGWKPEPDFRLTGTLRW